MKQLLSVFCLLLICKFLLSQNDISPGKTIVQQNKTNSQPSLIPLPQRLEWKDGYFLLSSCKAILIRDSALRKEGVYLQRFLGEKGVHPNIVNTISNNQPLIELKLANVSAPQLIEEAYELSVTQKRIKVTANSPKGIFNGLQTLRQLISNENKIANCEIKDWPAFSWRGYMVDVGRNFQSVASLKQQIEIMSRYKLNVFHFHCTEGIAWRLAIKQYPQLTAPENMLRNKGQYYSEAEMKDLIAFCKSRYITFVPEIDMPGHSDAFKRAFKTDMQTDSGMAILKNILSEIFTTYDVPYLHIGADEVKIINKNFVPEITAYSESAGKKIIGWEPGGNFNPNTIRQLWMDDAEKKRMQQRPNTSIPVTCI